MAAAAAARLLRLDAREAKMFILLVSMNIRKRIRRIDMILMFGDGDESWIWINFCLHFVIFLVYITKLWVSINRWFLSICH
jgi:hypothetical protein